MKKIVPFTKDLMFKTKIGEITSITLDNTLRLDNQFVSGEFIISGTYKMVSEGASDEKFNYNIPVDITIDSKYDTSNCKISIDDFTYEIINEETLKVNISVMLDDLDILDNPIEPIEIDTRDIKDSIELIDEIVEIPSKDDITLNDNSIQDSKVNNINVEVNNNMEILNKEIKDKKDKDSNNFEKELFNEFKDSEKEYSIYRVYTVKEDDTVDLILEKFNVTRELLSDYNDLDNLTIGSKIIIPSVDE